MKDKKGREKKAAEMTTRELARILFPREARAEVRREVAGKPKKSKRKKPAIKDDDA